MTDADGFSRKCCRRRIEKKNIPKFSSSFQGNAIFRSLSSMTSLFGRFGVTVRMLTLERGHWFDTTIFRILCHENLPLNLPDLCSFGGLVRNFDIGKKCCILYNIGALSVGLNNIRTSIVEKTHRKI